MKQTDLGPDAGSVDVDGLEAMWLIEGLRLIDRWDAPDDPDMHATTARLRSAVEHLAGTGGEFAGPREDLIVLRDAVDAYCYWEVSTPDAIRAGVVVEATDENIAVLTLQKRLHDTAMGLGTQQSSRRPSTAEQ